QIGLAGQECIHSLTVGAYHQVDRAFPTTLFLKSGNGARGEEDADVAACPDNKLTLFDYVARASGSGNQGTGLR
ncbi:hypothetical protein ABTM83_20630, partial [Acinetobacter baumannii]